HREEQELSFARDDALDHPLDLQALHAGDGVGDQRVHERRTIWTVGPLECRREAVVKLEGAVRDPRDVTTPDRARGPVDDARHAAENHERGRDPWRPSGQRVFGQKDRDARDGAPERAAQTIVFRSTTADLAPNAAKEAFDPWRLGHGLLPRSAE